MKNTIAVAAGTQVVLSPHLGDLEGVATRRLFEQTIATLGELHGAHFASVVHDQHPGYASTHYAEKSGLPRLAVQHHLAHVLACLLEHGQPAHDVLGIAWDGTGYGPDGTVWGGEFLLLQHNHAERFARLRPFRLPGSEAAIRDGRRVALGLAHEVNLFADVATHLRYGERETALFGTMLTQQLNSPVCSSAGRLFDAFGALLDEDLRDLAFVDGFHFHRGLVGLYLAEDLAGLHIVADLHMPLGKLALRHGGRQRGHQHIRGHDDQAPTSTSVHSSDGSGSGLCWANSAASPTILRISASIAFICASSRIFWSIRRFFR